MPDLHRYELAVLKAVKGRESCTLEQVIKQAALGKDETTWAIDNLASSGLIEVNAHSEERAKLTGEGRRYAEHGMPEDILLKRLEAGTINVADLKRKEEQIGLQWCKRNGLISIESGMVKLSEKGIKAAAQGVEEGRILRTLLERPEAYQKIAKEKSGEVLSLVRRNLIVSERKRSIDSISITRKGIVAVDEGYGPDVIDALDRSMITGKGWSSRRFKEYDVNVKVENASPARMHPLRKTVNEIKQAYLSMGFKEISGPTVESAFWVFDSLFIPQNHPARDVQDTFYLSEPETAVIGEPEHVKRLKQEHEKAWHDEWKIDEARQAVLRTHMTSISSRYVHEALKSALARSEATDLPVKLFSVGRIFRNENIDYKHLADFYQTDGIIIGKNLTMSNLFDTLISIFEYMGIKIKFKPSYFPFVEPGVEYLAYSKNTDSWIEMGGAGMIRSEVTGINRKNVRVLAWGMGVERILLIKDRSLSGISELYNSDVGWLRKRRIV